MSHSINKPPNKLDGADVLMWLTIDESVECTGKTTMYFGGKLIDSPDGFALCQYRHDGNNPSDYLVFY